MDTLYCNSFQWIMHATQHSHTAYSGSAQSRLNTLEMTCSTVDPHRMSSIGCKLLAAQHINVKYSGSTQSHLNLLFYLERPYRYRHTSRSNTVDQYHLDSILWKRSTQDEIHTWKCIFDAHGLQSHAQISKYNGCILFERILVDNACNIAQPL